MGVSRCKRKYVTLKSIHNATITLPMEQPQPNCTAFSILILLQSLHFPMQRKQTQERRHLLRLCFCNPDISFTTSEERRWRKPAMEIMRLLLMRPGKLPFQFLKNVLNIWIQSKTWFQEGECITCIILSTYVFISYSFMFKCFLGSVFTKA